MFSSRRFANWCFSVIFLAVSACGGGDLGCGCTMDPLPNGMLPPDQTVEGGGQIRVTPAGFAKLTALVPSLVDDLLAGGFNLGGGSVDLGIADLEYCGGGGGSCSIAVAVDFVNLSVPNDGTLRINAQFDVSAPIPVKAVIPIFPDPSCTFNISLNNGRVEADIGLGVRDSDGEMTLGLQDIRGIDISGVNISGCGVLGDVLNAAVGFIANLVSSQIGNFLVSALTPLLDGLVQGLVPDPLGLEGMMDLGGLVGSVSPGTSATLELRAVPGGYAELVNGGMSLGLIIGMNADEDTSTRSTDLDSEPALCVPPLPAPDFSAAPHNLPSIFRSAFNGNTFTLAPAGEFLGAPDPADDIVIGLSETMLDLAGHHMVTSGAMCLGVGTNLIEQLNLGTVGLLVPSLAELGSPDGKDPLLLVLRPTTALDFTIGEGTEADPSLQIGVKHMEIDFYVFLFDRYTRGFTISVNMNLGINLEYTTDDMGAPAIMPILSGLETENIDLVVLNSEFLRESVSQLETVLPEIFNIAAPLLAEGLGAITLPDFAGFTLSNLRTAKVNTSEDEFLAIYASLGASPFMAALGDKYPKSKKIIDTMRISDAPPSDANATLASVEVPKPEQIRAALYNKDNGALPEIVIDLETTDRLGRQLEWTWNINGGMNRPFVSNSPLIIRDRGLMFQGKYTIELRSRVKGDFRTLDKTPVKIPVVIDSAGPRISVGEMKVEDGQLIVPAYDLVSAKETVTYALGRVGQATPWTDFAPTMSFEDALNVVNPHGKLAVFARDELGNTSSAVVDLGPMINFHGTADGDGGCGCSSSANSSVGFGGMMLFAFTAFMLFGFGRSRERFRAVAKTVGRAAYKVGPAALFIVALGAAPACSCEGDPAGAVTCEIDEDCAEACAEGEIGICFEGECLCSPDVDRGRIGKFSDVAVSSNATAWVSAYNEVHGDLMVVGFTGEGRIPESEFTFVDGVPDGPVILPTSEVRGGIFDAGEDVGLHTSIAVAPNDTVQVSYFDRTNGSLKYTSLLGGTWTNHVVDEGKVEGDPELGFELAGQYSSITVRQDDNRPGIAYFVHVGEGVGNVRTELRFAAAQTDNPTSASDWTVWVVDTANVAAPDPMNPDIYPIPPGTGLMVDSARLSDNTPVLVYYDRENGDLKMARFDSVAGTFLPPETLDGDAGTDVGWYPSVTIDGSDNVHVTYVSATNDDLMYINTIDNTPAIVDDGYRIVGTTEDGLPKPEFHFVGDDSSVVLTTAGPVIIYQDATNHELLLARKNGAGQWEHETIAGNEDPFIGGYGFYAAADYDGRDVVMSSYVVDQPTNTVAVEVFRKTIVVE